MSHEKISGIVVDYHQGILTPKELERIKSRIESYRSFVGFEGEDPSKTSEERAKGLVRHREYVVELEKSEKR